MVSGVYGEKILRVSGVTECSIVRRINRFVVDVHVGDSLRKAHINNTGRLLEFLVEGRRAYCRRLKNPIKTDFRLFAVEDGGFGAIIDPQLQMITFEEAASSGLIPWLRGSEILRRNPRLGGSLLDYLLLRNEREIYVEVKSAVLRGGEYGWYAMYPDCPSARGRMQISEIIRHVEGGGRGLILFIAALPGVRAFRPNFSADPELYMLLKEAFLKGVELKAIGIFFNPRDRYIYLSSPDLKISF
ncbi:TPA: DNA/RNA nuclease SfsA [Candidatus Bathyarchaeota archaeon]|nr:DNA/RNA nuclease SfsA [Candidatus Bathyarchaeota archaeon]